MLTSLSIRNLVVIHAVDLEFRHGLTVLTGETGAGKSVIIEALRLALGERAQSQLIRDGADKAVVTAAFDISSQTDVLQLLKQHGLESGSECLLRRVLSADGRSRAFVNETPVTLPLLRQVAERLVDIHGQHASHHLLDSDTQRALLDAYAGLKGQLSAVVHACADWRKTHEQIEAIRQSGNDQAARELLRYQVAELSEAGVGETDIASLEDEHRRLANGATLLEHCAELRATLEDEHAGMSAGLGRAVGIARALERLLGADTPLGDLLEQLNMLLSETVDEVDRIEQRLVEDPARFEALDRRLTDFHTLARKHHVALAQLTDLARQRAQQLAELESHDDALVELERSLDAQHSAFREAAVALSNARTEAATRLGADLTSRVRQLGMPHGTCEVTVLRSESGTPQPSGIDRVTFFVATNPQQAPGPLSRIASGGELSRISLALRAATSGGAGVPVIVYDEIDTGIGGNIATMVGHNLRAVARHGQILCITHSPQVASAGEHHLLVTKGISDGRAESTVRELDQEGRESEIARMLGATRATDSSLRHARDLLTAAGEPLVQQMT